MRFEFPDHIHWFLKLCVMCLLDKATALKIIKTQEEANASFKAFY